MMHGNSNKKKLIVAICNFANAPKQRCTMHSAGLFTRPCTKNYIALNLWPNTGLR